MVSKVAPPQVSTAQKPTSSISSATGNHVFGAAAGGKQALVAVAQAQVHRPSPDFPPSAGHIVVHVGHLDLIVVTHCMGLLLKKWMFNGSLGADFIPALAESVEGFHLHQVAHLHHACRRTGPTGCPGQSGGAGAAWGAA
jgi:hypothetical protein